MNPIFCAGDGLFITVAMCVGKIMKFPSFFCNGINIHTCSKQCHYICGTKNIQKRLRDAMKQPLSVSTDAISVGGGGEGFEH